jgi:hypothetical protein
MTEAPSFFVWFGALLGGEIPFYRNIAFFAGNSGVAIVF